MANAKDRQVVEQVVQSRVAAGAMFTAYDITVQARAQGARIRHGEARDIVHNMFNNGTMGASYQRSVVDIGIATNPFVYHRYTDDPSQYQSTAGGATAANQPKTSQPKQGIVRRVLKTIWGGAGAPAGASGTGQSQQTSSPQSNQPRRRAPVKLDLDASAYLPITRNELFAAAKSVNLWASPFFGRRDLIPPVSDERTKLVDRAMLSQGLLSPEQLEEIHRVGAEMDHYRPDQILIRHQSQQAGRAAVEVERQKKLEERKQKKEEAKQRREKRRAEIEERWATDIYFLGRDVSFGLADRQSDLTKLHTSDLPQLSTPADVAQSLELSISQLRWLAFHNDVATRTHYIQFEIPKKSGGVRILSAPHKKLDKAQRWILDNVLNKLTTEPAAHGFVPGRSIFTNAQPHVGRAVLVNMDLENFFPNITFARVRYFFHTLGYSKAVATIFALLCTEAPRRRVTYAGESYLVATGKRGLPQGACTSPAISNQLARRLDRRLQGLAKRLDVNYTRYADDITFSGDKNLLDRTGYVMACVRHVAQDEGFTVNEKKNRVLRQNQSQRVTGLVVNAKPNVPRKKLKQVRAILHRAKTEGLEAQNRDRHPNFRSWLEGYIAFIAMTRPDMAAKFTKQLDALS